MKKEDLRPIGTELWQESPVRSVNFEAHQDGYQHRFLYQVKRHCEIKESPGDVRDEWAEELGVLRHQRRPLKICGIHGFVGLESDESKPWEEA
jgi:hypothetical protein